MNTQEKLAQIREALDNASDTLHPAGGDRHLCQMTLETLDELQEELKPKMVDVEKIARALAFYHHNCELDVFDIVMEDDNAA